MICARLCNVSRGPWALARTMGALASISCGEYSCNASYMKHYF